MKREVYKPKKKKRKRVRYLLQSYSMAHKYCTTIGEYDTEKEAMASLRSFVYLFNRSDEPGAHGLYRIVKIIKKTVFADAFKVKIIGFSGKDNSVF